MPLSLSGLSDSVRSLPKLDYPEGDLNVKYRANKITPDYEAAISEFQDQNTTIEGMVKMCAECIVEWDLLDDKGKPYQILPEVVRQLPVRIITDLVRSMGADQFPPKASSAN